jgi:hypothetical protein
MKSWHPVSSSEASSSTVMSAADSPERYLSSETIFLLHRGKSAS